MNRIACAVAGLVVAFQQPAYAGVQTSPGSAPDAGGAALQPAREVGFPLSGLKLRLPALPAEWRLGPQPQADMEPFLQRVRPSGPSLAVSFGIPGTLRSSGCEAIQQKVVERGGALEPSPRYLPPGYYPVVARKNSAVQVCGDATGLLAVVVLEYVGSFASEDLMEVRPVLEAMRTMLASAPASGAWFKATEVRLAWLNHSYLLPEGWKHSVEGDTDVLLRAEPGKPSVQINMSARYLNERDCDFVLATSGETYREMPVDEFVKRWHPRGRAIGAQSKVFSVRFCAEPRPDEFLDAWVLIEGDLRDLQVALAAVGQAGTLLDAIMASIQESPEWRAPFRGRTELRLPKTGFTLRLPSSGAEWDLRPDDEGAVDGLVRARPASPLVDVRVSVRKDLHGAQCARYIRELAAKMPGRTSSPDYVPAGWHPSAHSIGGSTVTMVCGADSLGRLVLASLVLNEGMRPSDFADLKVLLEHLAVAVGMPGAEVSSAAAPSAPARPAWTTLPLAAKPTPAASAAPSATPIPGAPVYVSTPSDDYDSRARLGQLYSLWYLGAARSGGSLREGAYGGLVGNDRLYLNERAGMGLRLAGWLGYGGRDGLAGDGTLAVGVGPIEEDDLSVLALAGVGVTRYGEELYPATFVGHVELRGQVKWDVLGLEGALGYYPAASDSSDSVRLDLRLYFALGSDQSWMLSWRRAIYSDFNYDLLVLGFGLPD